MNINLSIATCLYGFFSFDPNELTTKLIKSPNNEYNNIRKTNIE